MGMTIQDAISLFDSGKYKEAFEGFASVYNKSNDLRERADIMSILREAYYEPNEPELRGYYENNRQVLAKYSYILGGKLEAFSSLSFLLFPISEESYYLYDKVTDRFIEEYDGTTRHQMRYFFENLDHALKVEDEDNLYNLTFLFDNVRRSEDVAMDNHIYLLYSTWEPLQRVMQVGDLAPILEHQKFVFLVGKEYHSRYPVDFKKEFGIDYESMEPTPVRIDEVKRICYWYKHAYSGTALSYGILNASRATSAFCAHDFHAYSVFNKRNIVSIICKKLKVPQDKVNLCALRGALMQEGTDIRLPEIHNYLSWLEANYPNQKEFTVLELFKGYFIFNTLDRSINCRITPLIVFDPHIWQCDIYNEILHQFPYLITLTCVRNPITVFGRCYQYGLIGWDKFQTQYILASDYAHAQFLSDRLKQEYWAFRFEDLKIQPEKTVRAICKHLNIPFEKKMMEVEVPMTDKAGQTVRGFDQAPLHRDVSKVLSDFDQLRLKIFYAPILKYYDYPQFLFSCHPLSEQLIRDMLAVPFCFEMYNDKLFKSAPPKQELHNWIQEVLQGFLGKKAVFPKLIPVENTSYE